PAMSRTSATSASGARCTSKGRLAAATTRPSATNATFVFTPPMSQPITILSSDFRRRLARLVRAVSTSCAGAREAPPGTRPAGDGPAIPAADGSSVLADAPEYGVRILGVIDLARGQAVHARGGDRERYAPVATIAGHVIEQGNALALAEAYHDLFGIDELYVADLDA